MADGSSAAGQMDGGRQTKLAGEEVRQRSLHVPLHPEAHFKRVKNNQRGRGWVHTHTHAHTRTRAR